MDIIVENLSKSFGKQKAVDNVSFCVKKGEIIGFLGPNGAGKSTIMRIISCFLFPDSGDVRIGNHSIRQNPAKLKPLIGYLPEHNPLYEEMNVVDFLRFIASIHNIPRYKATAKVMDMIRVCGLEKEKHKTIRELSKGYKQRIGLAQTLIHDPEVIILDEPTTGLDPNQIVDIRELIKSAGKEKTIILSSHILAEIEATCDRVLILNKGQIVADGTTAELNSTHTHKLLRVNIQQGDPNAIYNELQALEEVISITHIQHQIFELEIRESPDIEKKIFELCLQNNWYIKELAPKAKGLEEVFRSVTQA